MNYIENTGGYESMIWVKDRDGRQFSCYLEDIKNPENLTEEEKDIYVFSSPSNVLAFLAHNRIPAQAKVVAWGASTAQELIQQQISVTTVLNGEQQAELLTWLSKVI